MGIAADAAEYAAFAQNPGSRLQSGTVAPL
jgi:hypothetical protein